MGSGPSPKSKLRAVLDPTQPELAPQPLTAPPSPLAFEEVDVTPDLAARWLEKNHPNNRPVAWRRVEAFASDMRAGAWMLTHQGICFDGDGRLIDGQHRLHAVIGAKMTVRMLVVRNAAGTFQDPIDRAGPRSIAVILGRSHREIACVNVLRMFEIGYEQHAPMTLHEADSIRERHQAELGIVGAVPLISNLTGSSMAAIVWALPVARERVIDFAVKAASGEMIARGHPAFAFRSWRERNRRLASWQQAMATLNCLRFHVTGSEMANVTLGEAGFRAFCTKRRLMKIPNTPGAEVVPAKEWIPWKSREGEGGDE